MKVNRKILENGDVLDSSGNFLGNVYEYLP